jgi:hypothetical protein
MTVQEQVIVVPGQCNRVAQIIRPLRIRQSFLNRPFLRMEVPREIKLRAYLMAVAICHQTANLIDRKRNLYGWDFIEEVFIRLAREGSPLLDPDHAFFLNENTVGAHLAEAFTLADQPGYCALDRLEERARLATDLLDGIASKFGNSVENLLNDSAGPGGLKTVYDRLGQFTAYSDPLRKKSSFLIKLALDAGLITLDPDSRFVPVMDYHMMRVLLRMGCVEVTDSKLRDDLLQRRPLPDDLPVRSKCIDAMLLISGTSGHPIEGTNDFFWSLGRSCCHTRPLCVWKSCEKKPCTFAVIVELDDHSACLFAEVCRAARQEDYRNLWQPMVETHYY